MCSKTSADLRGLIETYSSDINNHNLQLSTNSIRLGLVLYIHQKQKQKSSYTVTSSEIEKIIIANNIENVNINALRISVKRQVEKIASKKNITRDWEEIKIILKSDFKLPLLQQGQQLHHENSSTCDVLDVDEPPQKKMKTDCSKCLHKRIHINKLVEQNRKIKQKYKSNEIRKLKQAIQRKSDIEYKLRTERNKLKKDLFFKQREISYMTVRNEKLIADSTIQYSRKLKSENTRLKRRYKKLKLLNMHKLKTVSDENRALKKKIRNLELANESLQLEIADGIDDTNKSNHITAKKDNKTFSVQFRKAGYRCLINQVPVEATGILIKDIVNDLTGQNLDFCPDPTTISQFAYELGVLNDLQVAEALLKNENVTIAWDATSLDASHINEVHILLPGDPPKGLVLQISCLAGGTAVDYVNHISESINDTVETYSLFNNVDPQDCQKIVISKLKNTLSDRVAVNHCVRLQLEENLNIKLLELKCNVHPLDGIAKEARNVLKKIDRTQEIESSVFGNDCRVANFIYGLSKMRYKQGTGDPKGFKLFLKKENIPCKTIVRYVGNRLHVLFHLAGIFYHLQTKLLDYLNNYCNNCTTLRTALVKDLKNPSILLHLKVLGLLGKLLTGPWMVVLYGNKQNLTNLEVIPLVKACITNLKSVENDPKKLLRMKVDFFDQTLDTSEILLSLQSEIDDVTSPHFTSTVQSLIQGSVLVLERQLEAYLTGDLSNPTNAMLDQTKSAPVHNIFAEQVLGMTDHQHHRCPNATVGYIDGKVKASKNKTLDWVETKTMEEQEKMIMFSIKRARTVRAIRKKREQQINEIYYERQKDKQQKKDKKYRNKIEKQFKNILSGKTSLDEVSDLPVDKLETVQNIIDDNSWLVEKYIEHIWFENDENVLFHGHILELKRPKNKMPTVTIAYWSQTETEEEAADFKIPVPQVLADLYMGDLLFC